MDQQKMQLKDKEDFQEFTSLHWIPSYHTFVVIIVC